MTTRLSSSFGPAERPPTPACGNNGSCTLWLEGIRAQLHSLTVTGTTDSDAVYATGAANAIVNSFIHDAKEGIVCSSSAPTTIINTKVSQNRRGIAVLAGYGAYLSNVNLLNNDDGISNYGRLISTDTTYDQNNKAIVNFGSLTLTRDVIRNSLRDDGVASFSCNLDNCVMSLNETSITGSGRHGIHVSAGFGLKVRNSKILGNQGFAINVDAKATGPIDLGTSNDLGNNSFSAKRQANGGAICNRSTIAAAARGNTFLTCPPKNAGVSCTDGEVGGAGTVDVSGCL